MIPYHLLGKCLSRVVSSACSSGRPTALFGTIALEARLGITPTLQHRLQELLSQHSDLAKKLCADQTDLSPKQWQKLNQDYGNMTPVATSFQALLKLHEELTEAEQLCDENDEELKQLAEDEVRALKQKVEQQRSELMVLLLPKDQDDKRSIILEVRAGAGGDEAGLFAADLLHMYEQYALLSTWKVEVLEVIKTDAGGYKYASLGITGNNVFGRLKFESGVHRVQRVPETEAHGRIHTSTATVAVLPEPDEIDVNIREDDLRIDTYRSGGAGGQHVNTTDSAVRVTHLPSGIIVTCQDERSQHKNKAKALKILRARLYEVEKQKRDLAAAQERRQAVGTGDRNERIRTYNFPQGRVTDHRVNLTEHGLEAILNGERLDTFVDALQQQHQSVLMETLNSDQ